MEIQDKNKTNYLVQKVKEGDTNSFDKLFTIYVNQLFGFVNGYLKMKEEAEEVVQEVFLNVWRGRKNLNPELSFKAYLLKIAYHKIIEHFELVNKKQAYKHYIIEESVEFTNDMDERLNYQMLLDKVENLINQLPPRQKEVLIKQKKDGLSVKEIASQLGISPKTVENHIREALINIKRELGIDNISSLLFFMFYKEHLLLSF